MSLVFRRKYNQIVKEIVRVTAVSRQCSSDPIVKEAEELNFNVQLLEDEQVSLNMGIAGMSRRLEKAKKKELIYN